MFYHVSKYIQTTREVYIIIQLIPQSNRPVVLKQWPAGYMWPASPSCVARQL